MRPDRVLSLLAMLASLLGVALVLPFLDLPVAVLVGLSLAGGLVCQRLDRYLPNTPATVLTLAALSFYLLQLRLNNPVLPLVHALALLLALRQLTPPTPRHFLQTLLLSLILLAASSLLSLSPVFFPLLLALVLLVGVALVQLCAMRFQPDLVLPRPLARSFLRVALVLPIGSLLLMLFFYVVLPRSNTPLWHGLNPQPQKVTGYSDTVSPGTAEAVGDSAQVVLRVESPKLPAGQLYWRGAVFIDFDGEKWQRVTSPGQGEWLRGGEEVQQRVFLQPGQYPVLFTLDRPQMVQGLWARELTGRSYAVSSRQIGQRLTYTVSSRPEARLMTKPLPADTPERFIPEQVAPRLRELVRTWPLPVNEAEAIAQAQDFFRRQQLRYTTSGLPQGPFPIDAFLLDAKVGHCEFFASSFALLLRFRGIPSRLVGGFLGGEYNALGGYYLLREAMAHVWVEAYLPDEGWVRIDPSTLAINAGESLLDRRTAGLSLFTRLVDGLNYAWVRQVVTYDQQQQLAMIQNIGQKLSTFKIPTRNRIMPWLLAAVGMVCLTLAGIWIGRRQRQGKEGHRLFARFCHRVGWRPKAIPPAAGLLSLAEWCANPQGRAFLLRLNHALFTKDNDPAIWEELEMLLASVPKSRLPPPPRVPLGQPGKQDRVDATGQGPRPSHLELPSQVDAQPRPKPMRR